MKKDWMPSGKSLGIWLGAMVLAAWSLPTVPTTDTVPRQPQPLYRSSASPGVVATMAESVNAEVPAPGKPAKPQPQPKKPDWKAPSDKQRIAPQPPSPGGVQRAPAPAGERVPQQRRQTPESGQQAPQPGQQQALPEEPLPVVPQAPPQLPQTSAQGFSPYVQWPTARLRVRVIDGRTQQPLPGAEVVIIETEQRFTTDANGFTPWIDAPVIRNPRFRPLVAELHGQLGAIVYKNGYRDSVHLGIRMHEGIENESTVWMYKLGPGDVRIEPVLYQVPYHHIWLVELADRFRSKTQPGAGPERP